MITPRIREAESYLQAIQTLPADTILMKEDLINEQFLIDRQKTLSMYYAPHNEVINTKARIVIVGITPGWSQMRTAFVAARQAVGSGATLEEMLQQAKHSAGFAGSMRHHLIQMLDEIGIADAFGLKSAEALFTHHSNLLHTTSIIKYPVFKQGKNYTGHAPKMNKIQMVEKYVEEVFPEELSLIEGPYLIVPLGKAVSEILQELAKNGRIPDQCCLYGFPHPSGANGHRVKQFEAEKTRLQEIVKRYTP